MGRWQVLSRSVREIVPSNSLDDHYQKIDKYKQKH
jgi:hypothetical protein